MHVTEKAVDKPQAVTIQKWLSSRCTCTKYFVQTV